jgi:hypothetical protein
VLKARIPQYIYHAVISGIIVLLATLFLTGCNSSSETTSSTTGITPTSTSTTPTTSEPPYKSDCTLTFSAVPKLGETVDLTFTIKIIKLDERSQPAAGLAHAKASLSFQWTNTQGSYSEAYSPVQIPAEEVTISGELPWEGSYKDGLVLHSKIKLPHDGIWEISGSFTGEGWRYIGIGAGTRVAVAHGTAEFMDTEEFENSPLAYMGNCTYAGGVRGPTVTNEMYPVSLGLDISKAPRAGEEVTLSCGITSVIDVPDFSIQWYFWISGDNAQDIPEAELLSSKDLGWKTNIKKGESVVFFTTIKFPTEGNWAIAVVGKSGTNYLTGSGHSMRISITSTRSYFGWIDITPPSTGKPPSTMPGTTTAIYSTTTQC